MRIILVHGYQGGADKNFFPWLRDALRRKGFDVVVPILSDPNLPDCDAWTKALVDQCAPLDDETIVVGHSLGGAAALRLLEAAEARTTPHACVLISTPWMIRDEKFRGFFLTELDYDVLMWRASKFVVIHAKDDPVIPVAHGERYADVFHARLVEPESGGHFDGAEYPIILETVLSLIDEPVTFAPGESLTDEYADLIK